MASHQLDAAVGHGHGLAFGDRCAVNLRDLDVVAFEVVVEQRVDGDGLAVAGRRRVVGHVLLGRDGDRHRGGGLATLAVVHDHFKAVRARAAPVLVGRVGVLAGVLVDGHRAVAGACSLGVLQRIAVLVRAGDLAVERLVFVHRDLVAAARARRERLTGELRVARINIGIGRLRQLIGRHGHRDIGLLGRAAIGLRRVAELGVTHKACLGRELQLASHQLDAAVGHGHGLAFGDRCAVNLRDLDVVAFELVIAQHVDGD